MELDKFLQWEAAVRPRVDEASRLARLDRASPDPYMAAALQQVSLDEAGSIAMVLRAVIREAQLLATSGKYHPLDRTLDDIWAVLDVADGLLPPKQ